MTAGARSDAATVRASSSLRPSSCVEPPSSNAVTVCAACGPTPRKLPELWRICGSANAQETEAERRAAVGYAEHTQEQYEICVESVRKMVVDLPIAVLSVHRWEEVDEFAARSR